MHAYTRERQNPVCSQRYLKPPMPPKVQRKLQELGSPVICIQTIINDKKQLFNPAAMLFSFPPSVLVASL